jgi:phosphinothricin acetyltransferase
MNFVTISQENYHEVAAIYAQGIATGLATFETKVPPYHLWQSRHHTFGNILLQHEGNYLGWGSLAPVSIRQVYNGVAEVSVYVEQSHRGQGHGVKILQELIKISETAGVWTLTASIMRENLQSIRMHENCGFRILGFRERIAAINGIWRDNIILERRSNTIGI